MKEQVKTQHQVSNKFSIIYKEESEETNGIYMQLKSSCLYLTQSDPKSDLSESNPYTPGYIQSLNPYDEYDSIESPYSNSQYPMNNEYINNINVPEFPMPGWTETGPYVIF